MRFHELMIGVLFKCDERRVAAAQRGAGLTHIPCELPFGHLVCGELVMRYVIAWILGVPFGVIVLWYLVGHAACGR